MEVVGERHRLRQAVGHPFEHAEVLDRLQRIRVLGVDGVFLVDDSDPPLAVGASRRGIVIPEAGRASEHSGGEQRREERRSVATVAWPANEN